MQKSLVVRADSKPLRPVMILGAVFSACVGLFDILLAINSFVLCCTMFVPMYLGTNVVFGRKYLSICHGFITSNLINYKNIKAIAEKSEPSRHGARTQIVIQLHAGRAIELDVTAFTAEDRKRILELLRQKMTVGEAVRL